MRIVGITATRTWLTRDQCEWLFDIISGADQLHHGACTGGDKFSHQCALGRDIPFIGVHPPVNTRYMMEPDWNHPNVVLFPAKPYSERNQDIVSAASELIALPNSPRRPFSGTWMTIDLALGRIPVTICHPSGVLEHL